MLLLIATIAAVASCAVRNRPEDKSGVSASRASQQAQPREPNGPIAPRLSEPSPGLWLPELQPRLGEPLAGLSTEQLVLFHAGKKAFMRVFTPEDGLGPAHNLFSCGACHSNPTGGSGSITITMFGRADESGFDPLRELGGPILQAESIRPECAEQIPREANVIAQRITTSVLGGGLIEAIPDAAIEALATADSARRTGRVHRVKVVGPGQASLRRVGRFGWKSQFATLEDFSASAALNELGITNRLFPQEAPPGGDAALAQRCDAVPDPEDRPDDTGHDYIDLVTAFQRYLAPPPQTPRSSTSGERIFHRIGCADCHTPSFVTGKDSAIEPRLRGHTIRPYSDFLLHDMGPLGDGIQQGEAGRFELRTTPLWGFRIRFPVLHDGRIAAASLHDRASRAIQAHAGEGAAAAAAFQKLAAAEQRQLIAFLDSLGRVEFDLDGDNDVDVADHAACTAFRSGPRASACSPDDRCALCDVEQDGDVDLVDHALLQRAFTGEIYGSTLVVP